MVRTVCVEGHGSRRRDEQPDEADDELATHQREADDKLRLRADELWPFGCSLAGAEDAGDAVCLGQDGRVAHGEAQSQADHLRAARVQAGLGDDEKGHGVAQEDAEEQHEAQLAARGLDDGRVHVAKEDHDDE